jgi:hypothetical protein
VAASQSGPTSSVVKFRGFREEAIMRNATYCLLVVLFGSWSNSLGQNAPKFTTPQIVATFQRLNQTKEIKPFTIYTPPKWGTFRISVVMVLTRVNGSNSQWDGTIQFDDAAGEESPEAILYSQFLNTEQVEFPFRQKAGVPIKFSVVPGGDPSGSRYNVFVVVEQLM